MMSNYCMVERKYRNPSAFATGWHAVSQFTRVDEFNFDRFRYRIYNIEYDNKDEFFEALDQYYFWRKLSK